MHTLENVTDGDVMCGGDEESGVASEGGKTVADGAGLSFDK